MNISFRRSENLSDVASITFINMRSYYERYNVEWDAQQIEEKTRDLENYDILLGELVIGVFRLQFHHDCCYLRDLQVKSAFQNQGVGKFVLAEAKSLTKAAKLQTLKLRVFKISPAVELYKRNGFVEESNDERFFNLVADLS